MLHAFRKLFRKQRPEESFSDAALGQFIFEPRIGWKKQIIFGDRQAELVLGSDGEPPSDEMVRTAKWWLNNWSSQEPKIVEYVRRELRLSEWSNEPNLPDPTRFEVESINVLWRDSPTTTIIYFNDPTDDIRAWHVTFEGFEPRGFAYDD
jgi:hypothetical protein